MVKSPEALDRARGLITRIVESCPRRVAGSDSERRAHEIFAAELAEVGLEVRAPSMRTTTHTYALIALHFGIATLGTLLTLVQPAVALVLHALAALSYFREGTRRGSWIRALMPQRPSQNVLGVLRGAGELRLRVVVLGHIDAAYTGWLFNPAMIRGATREPPIAALGFLRKGLLVATGATGLLAVLDLVLLLTGASTSPLLLALVVLLGLPAAIAFVLNLQVVLHNTVVPGANDNLSGCAGAAELARRMVADPPAGVELVFGATGAEEAGAQGARRLIEQMRERWDPADTVFLGLDGLSNGTLRAFREGEILTIPISGWLESIRAEIDRDPVLGPLPLFDLPVGATDALPFRAAGYEGLTLGCVDPEIGAPRHYHRPSDTPSNLDYAQLMRSIDVAEAFLKKMVAVRARA